MKWNLGDERSKDIKDNSNVAYEGDFLSEWLAQGSQCSDCHQDHGHHIAGGRKRGDKSKHGRGSEEERKRERERVLVVLSVCRAGTLVLSPFAALPTAFGLGSYRCK